MKNKITLFLLTAVMGLLIYSCKKEFFSNDETKSTAKLSIAEARAYFKKLNLQSKSTNENLSDELTSQVKPFWHKAIEGSTMISSFVEAPLQLHGTTFSLFAFDEYGESIPVDKTISKYVFKRLIMYKQTTGTIVSRVLTYVPDKSYLEKNKYDATNARITDLNGFTGYIQVHTLDNRPISIYKYLNGKVITHVKLFRNRTKMGDSSALKTKGWQISCSPQFQLICSGSGGEDTPEGADKQCVMQQIGETCDMVWVPDPVTPTEPGEKDEPTNPTEEETSTEANRDILEDLDKYPCAKALVGKMPSLKNSIISLINKAFGKKSMNDLRFRADDALKGTLVDGRFKDINYTPNNEGVFFVDLNPDVLNNASQEYILVTMFHEALHAYVEYSKKTMSPSEFKAAFGELSSNGGRTLFKEIDGHFELAASNYLRGLQDAILSFNPNYDPGRAYDLAQGGVVELSPASKKVNDQERDTSVPGYTGTKCP
ncbi:hypothetical protein [Pedobacter sp. MW01-1-1]|uniref:hypothetical protein n=1 Tax=Pedobacter sp. MW01-1-1 TaxID=3383027 RepID=UPI003FEF7F61